MSHTHQVMTSSVKMDFGTPPEFLDLVRKVSATGRIGLDPCTVSSNPTNADHFFTPDLDISLRSDWADHGMCFVNPPYGTSLRAWTLKMSVGQWDRRLELVGLLPARTGTQWFKNLVWADALCFFEGRITFWSTHPVTGAYGPTETLDKKESLKRGRNVYRVTPAAFDVVVPYWGDRREAFLSVFEPLSTLTVKR